MDSHVAAKAVIVNATNQVLILREGERWHEPGGRLESGELLREGLAREIAEETGLQDVTIGDQVHVGEWFTEPAGKKVHIVAIFFACTAHSTNVTLSHEHQESRWVSLADIDNYPLQPESKAAIIKVLGQDDGR